MATTRSQIEVKGALNSGNPSPSTVSALQTLLGLDAPKEAQKSSKIVPVRTNPASAKSTSTRNGRAAVTKSRRVLAVPIHDDSLTLSAREKHALATETVNTCLRVLTDSLKSRAKVQRSALRENVPSTPERPRNPCELAQRALQPRCANSTPGQSPSKISKDTIRLSSPASTAAEPSLDIVVIAECACLGLSCLRSVDLQKLSGDQTPNLQLEAATLALIGKLIGHGLQTEAIRELRLVKRSLESSFAQQEPAKKGKSSRGAHGLPVERDALASLLHLDACFDSTPEVLPITVTYYMHALKVISSSRTPAIVENVLLYLSIETGNSPVDLILRHAKHSVDTAKSVEKLQMLSQSILGLCPSVCSDADEAGADPTQSPSAKAALGLQVLALRIRKLWWNLAEHQADVAKEYLEPFLKCATTFLRRSAAICTATNAYELLERAFEALGPIDSTVSRQTLFSIHSVLCSQAERAGMPEKTLQWADQMLRECESLEMTHARRVSSLVKRTTILMQGTSLADEEVSLDAISDLLRSSLTGNGTDYDLLLISLSGLSRMISTVGPARPKSHLMMSFMSLTASFALRYARSYPGRSVNHLLTVLEAALRCSKSTDDMLAWVTDAAAKAFLQAGTLKTVADTAATEPLVEASSVTSAAISLHRILRALVLKAVRSGATTNTPSLFDDEQISAAQRGVLLEWQLRYAVELATRTKYHEALKRLLPDLFRRLSNVYTSADYPLRRARAATTAFKLRESYPDLLSPHPFKVWHDDFNIDQAHLANDIGLQSYAIDLNASLIVAKSFSDTRPSVDHLKPSLTDWQRLIDRIGIQDSSSCDKIDDPAALVQQLQSVSAYFGMVGEDAARLAVLRMLAKLNQSHSEDSSDACTSSVDLAKQYLLLGYSEKAGTILGEARHLLEQEGTTLAKLHHQLAYAEYLLAIDNLDNCDKSLEEAKDFRTELPPENVSRDGRRMYEMLHAQGWLVQSNYLLETGSPHNALTAAKRSVRVLNSIWATLERSNGNRKPEPVVEDSEPAETNVSNLARGMGKLQLTPTGSEGPTKARGKCEKGASFWAVVPLLSRALLHLSDLYVHHGLFNEANYYSERAVSIAESVGSSMLLSRIRSHRSRLLTTAGRTEDAELCLAQDQAAYGNDASLALVDRHCTSAALRVKEGSLDEALATYEKAELTVEMLSSGTFLSSLERFSGDDKDPTRRTAPLSLASPTYEKDEHKKLASRKSSRPEKKPATKAASKSNPSAMSKRSKGASKDTRTKPSGCVFHLLAKVKAGILLEKTLMSLRLGSSTTALLTEMGQLRLSTTGSLRRCLIQHEDLMRRAVAALEMDVTLNVLSESTLSFPAITSPDRNTSQSGEPRSNLLWPGPTSKAVTKSSAKMKKEHTAPEARSEGLLVAARDCLLKGRAHGLHLSGTAQTHVDCAMLSSVTLLLSAISNRQSDQMLNPTREGLVIDLPRMKGLQFEQNALAVDEECTDGPGLFMWPRGSNDVAPCPITAAQFQEDYIDIMPKTWTAVSLCLSDDCSELHIARYRSSQSPFILRLPFSRHKPEGADEEAFDYHKGKAELQEIIGLSNYSCHNNSSLEVKGAKTKWWSERETLDRRLHELLINVENIWFGGFKAVFSQHARWPEFLARFRKSFEDILDSYLPSRKAAKGRGEKLVLDNKVLELFIGLGNDQDGTIDLDEPVADLLYFVVDMLQFNGERNAYDEIDFDSMAVDVLDALRTYHDSTTTEKGLQHLILVLDRRLHAFPWESLPYLEGASASRVGSMLSLRDCILALHKTKTGSSAGDLPNYDEGCHIVRRDCGAYILNPSSDLPGTQATLEPVLSTLAKSDGTRWTSTINEEPNEDRFSCALKDSSIMLYFGHGGGSQYIRPRAVKRLEHCSEVVWLMGCSSGAVSEYSELEPCALPLAYLLAGQHKLVDSRRQTKRQNGNGKCMAVVGTLWDVTDKDIDRFSLAIGEDWGLWPPSEQHRLPAKTPRKREIVAAPSTPQQFPKTPKTPNVRKTPAAAKTPARSRSWPRNDKGGNMSLSEAVARSRDACYLRYLNGAAAVVYGVPVYLGE